MHAPRPLEERFLSFCAPEPNSGCWLWDGAIGGGRMKYGRIRVNGKTINAQRISWELFRGSIPTGMHVCHKCDVPTCVNPAHLFVGSHKDNQDDKIRKRRHMFGDAHVLTKLSVADIINIRRDRRTNTDIARAYRITPSTVYNIKSRRNWAHVGD